MEIRSAIVSMVGEVRGGWTVAAAHLGMTYNALRNRVYETKGQTLSYYEALAIQELSGTTLFVEALAAASGGTFVKLPDFEQIKSDSVQAAFNDMYAELGEHFKLFMKAIEDNNIDTVEQKAIRDHGAELHRKVEQMQALMFSVYCRRTNTVKVAPAAAAAPSEFVMMEGAAHG